MRETIELIVKLKHIVSEIEKFDEFEHSISYEYRDEYKNFMEVLITLIEKWKTSLEME